MTRSEIALRIAEPYIVALPMLFVMSSLCMFAVKSQKYEEAIIISWAVAESIAKVEKEADERGAVSALVPVYQQGFREYIDNR